MPPILNHTIALTSTNSTASFFGMFDMIISTEIHLAWQLIKQLPDRHALDMPLPLRLRNNAKYFRTMLIDRVPTRENNADVRYDEIVGALQFFHKEVFFPNLPSFSLGGATAASMCRAGALDQDKTIQGLFDTPTMYHIRIHLRFDARRIKLAPYKYDRDESFISGQLIPLVAVIFDCYLSQCCRYETSLSRLKLCSHVVESASRAKIEYRKRTGLAMEANTFRSWMASSMDLPQK